MKTISISQKHVVLLKSLILPVALLAGPLAAFCTEEITPSAVVSSSTAGVFTSQEPLAQRFLDTAWRVQKLTELMAQRELASRGVYVDLSMLAIRGFRVSGFVGIANNYISTARPEISVSISFPLGIAGFLGVGYQTNTPQEKKETTTSKEGSLVERIFKELKDVSFAGIKNDFSIAGLYAFGVHFKSKAEQDIWINRLGLLLGWGVQTKSDQFAQRLRLTLPISYPSKISRQYYLIKNEMTEIVRILKNPLDASAIERPILNSRLQNLEVSIQKLVSSLNTSDQEKLRALFMVQEQTPLDPQYQQELNFLRGEMEEAAASIAAKGTFKDYANQCRRVLGLLTTGKQPLL